MNVTLNDEEVEFLLRMCIRAIALVELVGEKIDIEKLEVLIRKLKGL